MAEAAGRIVLRSRHWPEVERGNEYRGESDVCTRAVASPLSPPHRGHALLIPVDDSLPATVSCCRNLARIVADRRLENIQRDLRIYKIRIVLKTVISRDCVLAAFRAPL
jgi:hypothetical protein